MVLGYFSMSRCDITLRDVTPRGPQYQSIMEVFQYVAYAHPVVSVLGESSVTENELRRAVDGLPILVTLMSPDGKLEFANRQVLEYFGATLEELKSQASASTFHPDDRASVLAAWKSSVESGDPLDIEGRQRRADGDYRWFHVRGFPQRDATGHIVLWYVLQTDVDDRRRSQTLLAGENRLLEMVASGHSMPEILESICRLVENTDDGCHSSIVLVDPTGAHLEHGAAPSLPPSFITSIIGRPVMADSGPSAMAAFLNDQVIASDLATEKRWEASGWCAMALAHGLRACWSMPVTSRAGKVLGAFAIYYNEPRTPDAKRQSLIRQFMYIASIAVERAQSDAALLRSEARSAAILNSALDSIITIDHEGCITEFNPAAERTFGYRRQEVLNKPMANVIVAPLLRERHRQGLSRYLATGEARVIGKHIETTAVHADGHEFPVELAITRISLDGPASFTGYLRDITERKRSEEELRRSAAYLAEAQKLSLTGSFAWHVPSDKHFWSDETYRIFEYEPTIEVSMQLIMDRVHHQDVHFIWNAIALASGGKDIDYECRFQMPSGVLKYLHIVAHRVLNPDGQPEYIGAVQDVTERRLSEEALDRVRSELARVARATSFSALTASIAHEVNQPLAGIITNASTCLRMLGADPPDIDGALETARRTIRDGHRASDVIVRLRNLYSKKEITREAVDLNDATQEVIAISSSDLQRNRVDLRAELADDLPPIIGDRVQLQQVILNLLTNASDAMRSVDDRPRQIVIRTQRDGADGVRLSVRDAGAGFQPQSADKLFEAFYTTKSGGMGIGLSVSRSIIENHHGRIWAVPNESPGATVAFSIPCSR